MVDMCFIHFNLPSQLQSSPCNEALKYFDLEGGTMASRETDMMLTKVPSIVWGRENLKNA